MQKISFNFFIMSQNEADFGKISICKSDHVSFPYPFNDYEQFSGNASEESEYMSDSDGSENEPPLAINATPLAKSTPAAKQNGK